MAAYIIDGDKGGVGKSFVARALTDYLIPNNTGGKIVVIDCDPSNADVVGGEGFHERETVGGIEIVGLRSPVSSQEDWFATVDRAVRLQTPGTDFVFSLPAGAGLYIDDTVLSMFDLIGPVLTVWVMGKDQSSIDQLDQRVERAPLFYETGIVALNEHHGPMGRGTFDSWSRSALRRDLIRAGNDGWKEVTVPPLNAFITKQIGPMPHHRAVALSEQNELSPTIRVGIDAFRRVFRTQLRCALEKHDD